jgi:hypothetical protein
MACKAKPLAEFDLTEPAASCFGATRRLGVNPGSTIDLAERSSRLSPTSRLGLCLVPITDRDTTARSVRSSATSCDPLAHACVTAFRPHESR